MGNLGGEGRRWFSVGTILIQFFIFFVARVLGRFLFEHHGPTLSDFGGAMFYGFAMGSLPVRNLIYKVNHAMDNKEEK